MSTAMALSQPTTVATLLNGIADTSAMSPAFSQTRVSDLTLDSRAAGSGALFAAVPGEKADGRRFAEQAIENGAEGVLFESTGAPVGCQALEKNGRAIGVSGLSQQISRIAARLFDKPSEKMKVIGITGTNGKTTCALLLQQSLEALGKPSAIMGTLGATFQGETETTGLTTADAISVQRILKRFCIQGAEAVCMEVSSHGLDQGRVAAVNFNVAVLTNLSVDHLDYHTTLDAYGKAKKKLFDFDSLEAIIVNSDDQLGREILSGDHACRVISYGITGADVTPSNCEFGYQGISFDLSWQAQQVRLTAPLFGDINLPNLLATAATLLSMSFSLEQIANVFGSLTPPPGRMERFYGGPNLAPVVVDYAHTPDALERAIAGLKPFCAGDIWVVFGCGGDRDKTKRPLMGQVAEQGASHVLVTNDNPRNESPEEIVSDILKGITDHGSKVIVMLDRHSAIAHAIDNAAAKDIILVAGKGHEAGQVVGDQVLPFDDRDVVKSLLETRS